MSRILTRLISDSYRFVFKIKYLFSNNPNKYECNLELNLKPNITSALTINALVTSIRLFLSRCANIEALSPRRKRDLQLKGDLLGVDTIQKLQIH